MKHFLTLHDVSTPEIKRLIQRSIQIKASLSSVPMSQPMQGQTLCLLFSKPSTRTVSSVFFNFSREFQLNQVFTLFIVTKGWNRYGGHSLFLGKDDIQLGHGEPLIDTGILSLFY